MENLKKLKLPVPEWCFLSQALQWLAERKPVIEPVTWLEVCSHVTTEDLERECYREAKEALLLALVEEKILAVGLVDAESMHCQVPDLDESELVQPEEISVERPGEIDEVIIPPDRWVQDSQIYWERNAIDADPDEEEPSYYQISVPTADLFGLFDCPDKDEGKETPNGEKNFRGRIPEYKWDQFWAHIAVIADLDAIPDTQAELCKEMRAWCRENWKKEGKPLVPADSVLQKKISLIFQHPRK